MRPPVLLLGLALLALLSGSWAAARGEPKVVVVEAPDGEWTHLEIEGAPTAQGWLMAPPGREADGAGSGKPADLVVGLHGAGGNPKNFAMSNLLGARGAWCLVVAGHEAVVAEGRPGFMWGAEDVDTVVALTKHVVETRPIAKDRVILWGHSAGGTMTLETLARAPGLYAGGLTTAAPEIPDTRHQDLRVCAFLGLDDPNASRIPDVEAYLERLAKKRSKGACAFFTVEGLGHEVPEDDYLALGFDWILARGARGGEAHVPRQAKGREGPYHHILVRFKGAEGADGVKRSKAAAQKVLKDVKKAVEKGDAYFPLEAACRSEDAETAPAGGGVTKEALGALLGAVPELEPGRVSEILTTPRGLDLVWRAPTPAAGSGG